MGGIGASGVRGRKVVVTMSRSSGDGNSVAVGYFCK